MVNFENGMFDIKTGGLGKHKPEYYSTTRIPYKYNPIAQCDLWIKSLNEIFEGNSKKIELMQEFFGYCLSDDNEQKKGFLLLGDTDTGKSTIIDTFRQVVGHSNISNVPLHNLADEQHNCGLINKMVNIDPDVDKNAKDYEREFKIITGGRHEIIRTSPKFVPTFEFTPKCKLILAANIFPRVTDQSSAFYQRLLVVPCERKFLDHEKDRTLDVKLLNELPGIFNWMIRGLNRLKQRGSFEKHEFAVEALNDLREESNPVDVFFKEHIEADVIGKFQAEKGEVYIKYVEWCKINGNLPLSSIKFGQAVCQKYSKFTPKKAQDHATGKRVWRNIRYVHFKDETKEDISLDSIVLNEPAGNSIPQIAKPVNTVEVGTGSKNMEEINWEN
jgi:putative DNA primase/helicase